MADIPILTCDGLYTADNEISAIPAGALAKADNCVIRSKNVIEPRRGQPFLDYGFGASSDRGDALFTFGGTLLVQYGSTLAHDTGTALSAYSGTYDPPAPSTLRMKGAEAQQNFYFTTDAGVKALESASGVPADPALPRALDLDPATTWLTGTPNAGYLSPNYAVAYRAVWCRYDSHNRLLLGAPSGRLEVVNPADITAAPGDITLFGNGYARINTASAHGFRVDDEFTISPGEANIPSGTQTVDGAYGGIDTNYFYWFGPAPVATTNTVEQLISSGTKNVTLRVPIPDGIDTDCFLRVYRTYSVKMATTDVSPSDEMFLAHESLVSSTDISTGYVDVVDSQPDFFLGPSLYTNPLTGEGLYAENSPPPLANDITVWDGRMWFANTTGKHRFDLRLLGLDAPYGLQDGDTVTVAGQTYTASLTPSAATDFSLVVTGSSSQNIGTVARNLANAINNNPSNTTIYAYYADLTTEPPGTIHLEERGLGGSAFSVFASRSTAWSPSLPTAPRLGDRSVTPLYYSRNDLAPNRVYYSKVQQPEAVPLLNYIDVGSSSAPILRIVPLRNKMFVFKTDGIYALYGEAPYNLELVDNTTWLVAADSAVSVSNHIFCLTNQGVVAISESGISVISHPIEDRITRAIANVTTDIFGVGYDSERLYALWTSASEAYVFNTIGQTWTRWPISRRHALVNPTDDRLYLVDADTNNIRKENRDYTSYDYADEATTTSITSVTSTSEVVLASVVDVSAGDVVVQPSTNAQGWVDTVDAGTGTVTLYGVAGTWDADAVFVYKAIPAEFQYAGQSAGSPVTVKQFSEATYHFRRPDFTRAYGTFQSDYDVTETESTVARPGSEVVSTDLANRTFPHNKRILVPLDQQYAAVLAPGFKTTEAWSAWSLNGLTLNFQPSSTNNSR